MTDAMARAQEWLNAARAWLDLGYPADAARCMDEALRVLRAAP